jgi:hypothetical protein
MILLAMFFSCASFLGAQGKTEEIPEPDEATKRLMEAATPNERHKDLARFAGTWDTRSAFWVEGGEKPPAESEGTAVFTWALGERFLKQEFNGEFMGQPMAGIGYIGYDNVKKVYTQFWIDNTSTAMYTAEGDYDSTGAILTLHGTMDEPATGEMNKPVKYVVRHIDKYRWVYELHDMSFPEPNTKVGEILYTRRLEWH